MCPCIMPCPSDYVRVDDVIGLDFQVKRQPSWINFMQVTLATCSMSLALQYKAPLPQPFNLGKLTRGTLVILAPRHMV